MRIVVLTPRDHFHSPIILRKIGLVRTNKSNASDEIFVITTPKFPCRRNIWTEIWTLVKRSGWDYMLSMACMKITFNILAFFERIRHRPFLMRNYLTVPEVISYFAFPSFSVYDINSDSSIKLLKELNPDIIICNLFNQILKKEVLHIPRWGCLNIHTSFLPEYRGIAPDFWALVNNEKTSGATIHLMTEEIDDGAILSQERVMIDGDDSVFTLYRRCSVKASELLISSIDSIPSGNMRLKDQDEKLVSYYSFITPQAVKILRRNSRKFFREI